MGVGRGSEKFGKLKKLQFRKFKILKCAFAILKYAVSQGGLRGLLMMGARVGDGWKVKGIVDGEIIWNFGKLKKNAI